MLKLARRGAKRQVHKPDTTDLDKITIESFPAWREEAAKLERIDGDMTPLEERKEQIEAQRFRKWKAVREEAEAEKSQRELSSDRTF